MSRGGWYRLDHIRQHGHGRYLGPGGYGYGDPDGPSIGKRHGQILRGRGPGDIPGLRLLLPLLLVLWLVLRQLLLLLLPLLLQVRLPV